MSNCCPTCGAPIVDASAHYDPENRVFVANGTAARLTRVQGLVFDAIWSRRNRGAVSSLKELADLAWSGMIDGGPDYINGMSVHLAHIRARLEPTGYTITHNRGTPKQGFRVLKIEGRA